MNTSWKVRETAHKYNSEDLLFATKT